VAAYLLRRLGQGALTVLGVLLLLFLLFFQFADPRDVAERAVGEKARPEVIEQWLENHGYNKPHYWACESWRFWVCGGKTLTDSLLYDHFSRMLRFDFGKSDADSVPIAQRIREGAGPSMTVTVPLLILGLPVGLGLALLVAYFRDTYIDRAGVVFAVFAMSVSILIYIIGGQFLIGKLLRWFPVSGFDPSPAVLARFIALPVLIGLVNGLGGDVRFYRTVFVEETNRDYVRTARSKGAGDVRVMTRHVLPNALIPILTRVVLAIPFLFVGSLLLESFFGIPGLGSITIDAINANDFATLRAMVYIGALLLIFGQLMLDVAYTWADPRVRLS
jgi:peptide/nickel transport system permease protein